MLFWRTLNKKWFVIYLTAGFVFGLSANPMGIIWSVIMILMALREITKAEKQLK